MGWGDTIIAYVYLALLLVCLALTIWSIVVNKGPEKPLEEATEQLGRVEAPG